MVLTILVVGSEWGGPPTLKQAGPILMIAVVALLAVAVSPARRLFVWAALAVTAIQIAVHDDWAAQTLHALSVAAFVAAFFSALTTLRHATSARDTREVRGKYD